MKKGDTIQVEHWMNGECLSTTRGKIQWIHEDQLSMSDEENVGAYLVFNPKDEDRKIVVLIESAPSFQSQVASLSDEELQAAVDSMRSGRISIAPLPKEKKPSARAPKASAEELQLQTLMSQMSPEEQIKIKQKLGILI